MIWFSMILNILWPEILQVGKYLLSLHITISLEAKHSKSLILTSTISPVLELVLILVINILN